MASSVSPESESARPGRTARRDLVETQIYDQAALLFAERGFAATTPQDIAEAVGISRQALYYYVKSKDEILARLVSDVSVPIVEQGRAIAAGPGDPCTRLRELVRHAVVDRAANRTRFLLLERSESALPADVAEGFLQSRRAALAFWRELIEEGIAQGYFRAVDARVAALSMIGMCNWVAWWFDPEKGHHVESIAAQIADSAVAMLAVPLGADGPAADAAAVLDQMDNQLQRLRLLLPPQSPSA
jgi:AcrR family transcriptional regulator